MKSFLLMVTSAFVLAGEIQSPGTIVSLDEDLAKNMLRRGKVRLPTAEELEAAGHEVPKEAAEVVAPAPAPAPAPTPAPSPAPTPAPAPSAPAPSPAPAPAPAKPKRGGGKS